MTPMTSDPAPPNPALELLLNRRSCHKLTAPGPSDAELALMLRAALRVPDFGNLRPYRFLAARGEGLDRLGQAMRRAAEGAGKAAEVINRTPRMPHRAPLVYLGMPAQAEAPRPEPADPFASLLWL